MNNYHYLESICKKNIEGSVDNSKKCYFRC